MSRPPCKHGLLAPRLRSKSAQANRLQRWGCVPELAARRIGLICKHLAARAEHRQHEQQPKAPGDTEPMVNNCDQLDQTNKIAAGKKSVLR